MSSPYFTLRVVDITRETPDAITLHLEHPDNLVIPYKPGQFLTLILPVNGKEVRRSYSLSSTPHEGPRLSVTIKRVADGLVSNYILSQVHEGDDLKVMEPLGNFCHTCLPAVRRQVVLFGAGSGITPLMSILKAVLREEPESQVTLLYGNRNEDSVIFKAQLDALKEQHQNRLHVEYIYSQPRYDCEHRGRMNRSMILKILERLNLAKKPGVVSGLLGRLQLIKQPEAVYYLCGPAGMMEEVRQALIILHVPANRIFQESFISSKPAKPAQQPGAATAEVAEGGITTQTVTILYEGAEYKIKVNPEQTILGAALEQDVDLPYSCQAGLCTACRGRSISGKVHMDERDGLSDAELEEGYVLNCVGHPLTSDVIIEIG
ncbi:2Fe-2S iron-sulfur cluster-binding protein [Pontibacter chitinilyticus]|uniref:2Fe-2S iron-sulfur cluster-binding protein n=1 Tax=Pontibacter chitinilyticus TaxID=2674989 RepID=UPI00321C3452